MSRTHTVGKVATSIARRDGVLQITYHGTDVVSAYPDGRIILDTGGWRTTTTKARMNQAASQFDLGFMVYQRNYRWYVVDLRGDCPVSDEFEDRTYTLAPRS